jgi:L-arabinose isomerase
MPPYTNMQDSNRTASPLTIGLIPVTLDLYDRLNPQLRTILQDHIEYVTASMNKDNLKILCAPVLCSDDQIRQSCKEFASQEVDLLVVSHLSYSPSGQICPALLDSQLPLLLWPIQELEEIIPDKYTRKQSAKIMAFTERWIWPIC